MSYASDRGINELELIDRLRFGDRTALSEIYNRYWEDCYDIALFLLKDSYQAEDVLHDVFLAFWNARARINIRQSLQAYLSQSIRYECYRILKQRKRNISVELIGEELVSSGYFETLDAKEMNYQVETALKAMPKKSREIFFMSREDELTYVEIAAKMGLTKKAVEYHMSKVLKALRRALLLILFLFLGLTP